MDSDLVRIYSVGLPYKAELMKQKLFFHNIHSFIVNKQDSAYKFGDLELYVHRDDVIRAKKLIQELESY